MSYAIRRIRGKYRMVRKYPDGRVRIAMKNGSAIDSGGFLSRIACRLFMERPELKGAPDVSELVHGTLKKNLSSIKKHGLNPQVGAFVEGVHGCDSTNLVYACDVMKLDAAEYAMRYYISRELRTHWPLVTHDEIVEYGLLAIVPRALFTYHEVWQKGSPIGVESNDWISTSTVHPLRLITGEAIREFFEANGGFNVTIHDTWLISQFPEYADARMVNFRDLIISLNQSSN